MYHVILLMSIVSFLLGFFFLVVKVTASKLVAVYTLRLIGFLAVLTPVIYWLYLLGVLK